MIQEPNPEITEEAIREIYQRFEQGGTATVTQAILERIIRRYYIRGQNSCMAGPMQPMNTAPKDGTRILLILKDGIHAIGEWGAWTRNGDGDVECWTDHYDRFYPPNKVMGWAELKTKENGYV